MKLLPVEVKLQNNIVSLFASGEASLEMMMIVKEASKEVNLALKKIHRNMGINEVKELFISINSTNVAKRLFAAADVEYTEILNDLENAPDNYYKERFDLLLDQMGI